MAFALVPPSASAAEATPEVRAEGAADGPKGTPNDESLDQPNERRAGVVLGLMGGYGFGSSNGYPNSASMIDNPDYYSSSGLMTGSGGSFFAMGAIADYLNVGFWFGGGNFANSDFRSSGGGGGLRVEAFPLYQLVPSLRDLGVVAQFGLGSAKLSTKRPGNYPTADGVQSFLGAGVFYEWSIAKALGGHFAGGPSAEYDVITAWSIGRNAFVAGGRFVFYGGM
jgi:hypothetical protein